MRNKECPCRDCEDRKPACQGKCKPFLEWKKICAENRAKADAERAKYKDVEGYRVDSINRSLGRKAPMR